MIWDSDRFRPAYPLPSWDEYDEWLVDSLHQLQERLFDECGRLFPRYFCSAFAMAYKILVSAYKQDQQEHISYENFNRSVYEEIRRLLEYPEEHIIETEVSFELFDHYFPQEPNLAQVQHYAEIALLCCAYDPSDDDFIESVTTGALWDRDFVIAELMVKIRTLLLEDKSPKAEELQNLVAECALYRDFIHCF